MYKQELRLLLRRLTFIKPRFKNFCSNISSQKWMSILNLLSPLTENITRCFACYSCISLAVFYTEEIIILPCIKGFFENDLSRFRKNLMLINIRKCRINAVLCAYLAFKSHMVELILIYWYHFVIESNYLELWHYKIAFEVYTWYDMKQPKGAYLLFPSAIF